MRERMVNLNIGAYLASKVVVLGGFGLLQCLLLLLVISFKVEMPWGERVIMSAPFEMYITLVLAVLSGIGLGLLISALVKASNTVIYLILVVLFVQIIFSGVLFTLPKAAAPLAYMTPTRWAMEALGASINIEKLNNLSKTYIEEVEKDGQTLEINEAVESKMEFDINYDDSPSHLLGVWVLQLLFVGALLGLAGWVLKRQDVHT
jgi:hypothetical protein